MAEDKEPDEVPTLDLTCFATGQPIPVEDAEKHGVLFVFMAEPESPYGAAVLSIGIDGHANAVINGAVTKDAKTIRITLHRDKPGGPLYGYSYQTVEMFEGITDHKDEDDDYPHGM